MSDEFVLMEKFYDITKNGQVTTIKAQEKNF